MSAPEPAGALGDTAPVVTRPPRLKAGIDELYVYDAPSVTRGKYATIAWSTLAAAALRSACLARTECFVRETTLATSSGVRPPGRGASAMAMGSGAAVGTVMVVAGAAAGGATGAGRRRRLGSGQGRRGDGARERQEEQRPVPDRGVTFHFDRRVSMGGVALRQADTEGGGAASRRLTRAAGGFSSVVWDRPAVMPLSTRLAPSRFLDPMLLGLVALGVLLYFAFRDGPAAERGRPARPAGRPGSSGAGCGCSPHRSWRAP